MWHVNIPGTAENADKVSAVSVGLKRAPAPETRRSGDSSVLVYERVIQASPYLYYPDICGDDAGR